MSVHGRQVNFASRSRGRLSELHTVTLVPLDPCRSVSPMSIGAKAPGGVLLHPLFGPTSKKTSVCWQTRDDDS